VAEVPNGLTLTQPQETKKQKSWIRMRFVQVDPISGVCLPQEGPNDCGRVSYYLHVKYPLKFQRHVSSFIIIYRLNIILL
jgi:hypothetical protein